MPTPPRNPFTARAGLVSFPPRLTVASARKTAHIVGPDLKGHQAVIFDLSRTIYLDETGALLIREFVNTTLDADPQPVGCIIAGLSGNPADMLNALGVLDRVPEENIVPNTHAAALRLRVILEKG